MGHIFYIMGKSATGKDHIYRDLLADPALSLCPLVIYTTRPQRRGETEGKEYHFTDEAALARMKNEGRVIESRVYQTVNGPWHYFTADDGSIDPDARNYLGIGTLESYKKLRHYFADKYEREVLVPLYIESPDEARLTRALGREKKQAAPNYAELCRRFLADTDDFSEDRLREAGITKRFMNNTTLEDCIKKIRGSILSADS